MLTVLFKSIRYPFSLAYIKAFMATDISPDANERGSFTHVSIQAVCYCLLLMLTLQHITIFAYIVLTHDNNNHADKHIHGDVCTG